MGTMAPAVANMSLQPIMATKRANNFSAAESRVVTFSAKAENDNSLPPIPSKCDVTALGDGAHTISCWEGEGQFKQTVARSFWINGNVVGYTNPTRSFAFDTPLEFSHVPCHANDPWGVIWYNEHLKAGHMKPCIPTAAWNKNRYLASNPDDWLFDISNFGFGQHPDY